MKERNHKRGTRRKESSRRQRRGRRGREPCSTRNLDKDAPDGRAVQPPDTGEVVALPHVGGLHHEYMRLAA